MESNRCTSGICNMQPKIRVLVVSEYYWPDQGATGRLLGQLMSQIANDYPGFEITVLTSDRLHRGANTEKLTQRERVNGVAIRRLRSRRSSNSGFGKRLWSDCWFSLHCARHLLGHRYDLIVMVTNPPIMPLILNLVRKVRRIPALYIIHDLYPDVGIVLGNWSTANRFVRLIKRWQGVTLRSVDRVVVLGRCMKSYLESTYRVPEHQVDVITNWFDLPSDARRIETENRGKTFRVLYSGNLGRFQDFDTLLDAAALLESYEDIEIHIMGEGAKRGYIESEIRRRNLRNVSLRGFVDEREFVRVLQRTRLGVVTLEPGMEGLGVPSKMYNLLASGTPLLGIIGTESEVAKVIKEHECGFQVNPGDSQMLAQAVLEGYTERDRLQDMARRGVKYALGHASLAVVASQYAKAMTDLAEKDRRVDLSNSLTQDERPMSKG